MSKAKVLKGTRDFGPVEVSRRNFIFNHIRDVFELYGFQPIETPAMEALSTLTGKYGQEGDQLIFKIMNNGDFLEKADPKTLEEKDSKALAFQISKRALRYDLTVPFARFVATYHSTLPMPFKRYQIQPVWRGDRPSKGRYQEFFQCDADIIGSDSLLNEVDLTLIFDAVFDRLGVDGVVIRINNRKVLAAMAEVLGVSDKFVDFTVAIDKLDKIGVEGVSKELIERGFTQEQTDKAMSWIATSGSAEERIGLIGDALGENGAEGIDELQLVWDTVNRLGLKKARLEIDFTLARGLNYYTGTIFEVVIEGASVGSVCGGGRYDDLTGIFGVNGMSGVGISFGADRIYDVMLEKDLFPKDAVKTTQLLLINFGGEEEKFCLKLLQQLRNSGIRVELFPEAAKLKKQMRYADQKGVSYVAMIGSNEIEKGKVAVKNMSTGEQQEIGFGEIAEHLS